MAGGWGTETEFELTTLERLRALGYTHAIGAEIAEKHRESASRCFSATSPPIACVYPSARRRSSVVSSNSVSVP